MDNNIVFEKYLKWKDLNSNINDQYDCIDEFFNELGRGEIMEFMIWVESLITNKQ